MTFNQTEYSQYSGLDSCLVHVFQAGTCTEPEQWESGPNGGDSAGEHAAEPYVHLESNSQPHQPTRALSSSYGRANCADQETQKGDRLRGGKDKKPLQSTNTGNFCVK